jgi:hypothetical protein
LGVTEPPVVLSPPGPDSQVMWIYDSWGWTAGLTDQSPFIHLSNGTYKQEIGTSYTWMDIGECTIGWNITGQDPGNRNIN